ASAPRPPPRRRTPRTAARSTAPEPGRETPSSMIPPLRRSAAADTHRGPRRWRSHGPDLLAGQLRRWSGHDAATSQLLLDQGVEDAPVGERDHRAIVGAGQHGRIAEAFGALVDESRVD